MNYDTFAGERMYDNSNHTHARRWSATLVSLLAIILALSLAQPLLAAPGALDPGFGSGGIVTTAVGPGSDNAYAIAIDGSGNPDGNRNRAP